VTELTSDREETIDELQMVINKEAATEYGLAPVQIAQTVNNTTRGVQASQILAENDEVYSVFVKFDDEYKNSVEKLRTLKLRTPAEQFIELQELADISIEQGPVSIQRVDQAESVSITMQYKSDISLGDMSDK